MMLLDAEKISKIDNDNYNNHKNDNYDDDENSRPNESSLIIKEKSKTNLLISSLDSDENRYVTESSAREALAEYVANQCCFSSKPLAGLNIKSLKTKSVYKV